MECFAGSVLLNLPVEAMQVSPYLGHILSSIGRSSNVELMLSADISRLKLIAELAVDKVHWNCWFSSIYIKLMPFLSWLLLIFEHPIHLQVWIFSLQVRNLKKTVKGSSLSIGLPLIDILISIVIIRKKYALNHIIICEY